ncbi:MAG: folate-binding protein, partial [Sneathiella sp.]
MPFAKLDSRSLLQLTGKDIRDFLQNLVTNDLEPLSSEKAVYAALLTPQGKFLHDFLILEDENALYLDCLTERTSDLVRRLTLYKLRADVLIEDVTDHWDLCAEFGTDTEEASSLSLGQVEMHETYRRYRDPRQESLGYRIIGKKGTNWLDEFGSPSMADEAVYHDLRLSLGIP